MSDTKSEIQARMDELSRLRAFLPESARALVDGRLMELGGQLELAAEDLFKSVIRSHEVICAVKKMDAKAAYGQDPGMYYTLAVCAEAGEMANKIVKALRNGPRRAARHIRAAVESELPDVFIYGAVLGHVLDMDVARLVSDKANVVIERALSGYYGPALDDDEEEPIPEIRP